MDEILTLAVRQGGIIRRDQARALGLSDSAIDRRIRSGRWSQAIEGVFRVFPAGDERDLLAGAVAALPTAVVSHGSAARLHRLDGRPTGGATVTVHASRTWLFPEVEVHRTRTVVPSHVVRVDGLPVTSVARTVIDLAAEMPEPAWQSLAEGAVVSSRCSVAELREVASVACGRGRTGSRLVRRFLDDPHVGTSRLQRLAIEALAAANLPTPEIEYPIPWSPGRRFDLAYPQAKLAIELDGRRWHSTADRFQADRERDREALAHGWVVVRFTWQDLTGRPREFVGIVARLLVARTEG